MNRKIATEIGIGIVLIIAIIAAVIIWLGGRQQDIQAQPTAPVPSIQTPVLTEKNCVKLGEFGPNGSLGPMDPSKGRVCCEGLVSKSSARCAYTSNMPGGCTSLEGCASTCLACGDGKCDSKYENKCNCPEDCKSKD